MLAKRGTSTEYSRHSHCALIQCRSPAWETVMFERLMSDIVDLVDALAECCPLWLHNILCSTFVNCHITPPPPVQRGDVLSGLGPPAQLSAKF